MNKIFKLILKWFIVGILGLSFLIYSFIKTDEAEKRSEEIGRIALELKQENQALKAEKNSMNGKINNLETRLEFALNQLKNCQ